MINYIKGNITRKATNYIWIENHGMGYIVNTSAVTLNKLQENEEVCMFTYMHVREDVLALYGFSTEEELDMFKKLLSVNKVGPKAALAILSIYEVDTLKLHILSNNDKAISKASGIGAKTATKIILDLKDKVGKLEDVKGSKEVEAGISDGKVELSSEFDDILDVLLSFGFSRQESTEALENMDTTNLDESTIIRKALKSLNR